MHQPLDRTEAGQKIRRGRPQGLVNPAVYLSRGPCVVMLAPLMAFSGAHIETRPTRFVDARPPEAAATVIRLMKA